MLSAARFRNVLLFVNIHIMVSIHGNYGINYQEDICPRGWDIAKSDDLYEKEFKESREGSYHRQALLPVTQRRIPLTHLPNVGGYRY
jgi:hypothetical protein